MREILFRGKSKHGEWVYGVPVVQEDKVAMVNRLGTYTFVEEKTVGQYTGLRDANGNKIFEGDIVKAQDNILGSRFCDGIIGKVVYCETAYFIEPKNIFETEYFYDECAVYEIIGNIHDNPELLKEI